jgi:ATP-dependent helicase/nuclease subunit A
LAEPADWAGHEAAESEFQDAEKVRLDYVAATRAGRQLVITLREKYANHNPWQTFEPDLKGRPAFTIPAEGEHDIEQSPRLDAVEPCEAEDAILTRWRNARAESYRVAAAKEIAITGVRPATGGEGGMRWGGAVHRLLEIMMMRPDADLESLAPGVASEHEIERDLIETLIASVRAVMASALWRRASAARRRLVEVPVEGVVDDEAMTWAWGDIPKENFPSDDGTPTLARGVIDLAFEEDDGWILVDYKTDRASDGSQLNALADHYAPQTRLYAWLWARASGAKIKDVYLYFTRVDQSARIECPSTPQ